MAGHRVNKTNANIIATKSTLPGGKEYVITEGNVATSVEGFTGKGVTGTPQFFETYGDHKDIATESLPFSQPSGSKPTNVHKEFLQEGKKHV